MSDTVLLTTLLLEYPNQNVLKVQKLISLAENLYGVGTNEYYDYINNYTEPTEKDIANIIFESISLTEAYSKEYMGVTIYKEDDGKYNVPELGIYNVVGSVLLKSYIRNKIYTNKIYTNKKRSFREEVDTVLDNINYISNLTENQFLNFVLNEMTESDYNELGGTNFKNFVLVISEIVDNDWEVPQSLISENYIFDEGVGDFIKKVKDKVSDAHLSLSYVAPEVATALGDAYGRHTAATQGLKNKLDKIGSRVDYTRTALGDAYGRHTAATQAAGKKISDAKEKVGRIYNKVDKILSPAPRSRVDTAATKEKVASIYSKVDKVLSPPPMSQVDRDNLKQRASNVSGILDRMILSPRPTNTSKGKDIGNLSSANLSPDPALTKSQRKQRNRSANEVLDKLRNDGDVEKAENKIDINTGNSKAKKMTTKEKEAKYDEAMKEDLDFQLEFIKNWLYENEIFDNVEDIDEYILEQMNKEEYFTIISELDNEENELATKLVKAAKLKNTNGKMSPKERSNVSRTNTMLDTSLKFSQRYPNNHIDSTTGKDRKFMTIAQRMDNNIDNSTAAMAKFNKSRREEPYYGDIYGSVAPAKPLDIKKTASSTSQQRGTALVSTSKAYDTPPKTYEDRPTDSSYRSPLPNSIYGVSAKPLGRAIPGNPHSLIDRPRIPKSDVSGLKNNPKSTPISPHVRGQVTDRDGNTTYSDKGEKFTDNTSLKPSQYHKMTTYGGSHSSSMSRGTLTPKNPHVRGQLTDRNGNTTYSDDGQGFANSLKNSIGKSNTKPSSLISTVGKKAKTIGKNVVDSIKRKLRGEEFEESDIKNFITEEEFLEITEWLVENDIFEYDEELEQYLIEGLNWDSLEQIHNDIEDRAVELIIESLYDIETSEQTYIVLESILGEEIDILLEEMQASDVNESPMPMKMADCSCGKYGCKSCSKKSWKAKIYKKMKGDN